MYFFAVTIRFLSFNGSTELGYPLHFIIRTVLCQFSISDQCFTQNAGSTAISERIAGRSIRA